MTSRQLDQIDSMSFSQSARSLRLATPDTSPGLTADKGLTSCRSSPLPPTSSSESSRGPSSPLAAGQVLKDFVNTSETHSPMMKHSSLVNGSSASGSEDGNSSGSFHCPSDSCDSLGNKKQQRSSLPSASAPVSDVDSPLSTASGPARVSAFLASRKLPQSPDSAPATLSEKSAGRGSKLLALLKSRNTATKVGGSASHSWPELSTSDSGEPRSRGLRASRKPPERTNLEQMPKQMLLSSGLDKDLESQVEPGEEPYPDLESQVEPGEEPYPDGGQHQALMELAAEEQTSPKLSDDHNASLGEPVNPYDVSMNTTASELDVVGSPMSISIQSIDTSATSPQKSLPSDQASRTTPATQREQISSGDTPVSCERISHGNAPMSCDSPGPLEHSPGSSTDVSLCSNGLDRSSSSSRLTASGKRLPRIASRSSSRTATPVSTPAQKPPTDQPSSDHSTPLHASPVAHGRDEKSDSTTATPVPPPSHTPLPDQPSSAQSTPRHTSPRARGRIDNYDCIPEMCDDAVPHPVTVPNNDRYLS